MFSTDSVNKLTLSEKQEISAIISLLDDSDVSIVDELSKKLRQYGTRVIPFLAEQEYFAVQPETRSAVARAIKIINYDAVCEGFENWLNNNDRSLIELVLIMDRLFISDPSREKILTEIEKIRLDIWLELNDELTAFEQFRIINHFFFSQYSFEAGGQYNEPFDLLSFQQTLFNRSGSAMMLTVIYQIIALKLNLPVKAYQLGGKYFLAYPNYEPELNQGVESPLNEVMFFILPDQNGDLIPPHVFADLLNQLRKSNISIRVNQLDLKDTARFILNNIIALTQEDENHDRERILVAEQLLTMIKT